MKTPSDETVTAGRRCRVGLFLGTKPSMGGVYPYSLCLLDAALSLPSSEFDVVIVYADPVWGAELKRRNRTGLRARGAVWSLALGAAVTWSEWPLAMWYAMSRAVDPVARLLERCRADFWVFSSYSFVSCQMPVPSVGIIHDLLHLYKHQFPADYGPGGARWRDKVFRRVAGTCIGSLVDSEYGRRHASEAFGVSEERFHVLPYMAPAFEGGGEGLTGFEQRIRLPRKFIFYPAQFWEHKNHRRLINAIATLKESLPDVHLVLTGDPRLGYRACRNLVESLDLSSHVTFLGQVSRSDLGEIYRRARALVYPTFCGPTNLPPLEAFAAGCPVAVSGILAMPEQVGDAGLLFDPTSTAEIAGAIRVLWTDDAFCADLARRGALRHRAWRQPEFSARFAAILREIAAGRGRPV